MPRPKLPVDRKTKAGTLRNHRERKKTAAECLVEAPSPPDRLGEKARQEWASLAPLVTDLGTLTAADLRTLELLCETLATESTAREAIQQEGMTLPTGSGGTRAHPAIRVMEVARSQAANLLRDFGLSPKARQYVSPAPKAKENPFSRQR